MDLRLPVKQTGFQLTLALGAMLLGTGVCVASPITYPMSTLRSAAVVSPA
jgi:hypothetical protein